ncbi:MAG: AMP-binding protein [Coriobacteriales bacterium]|jgi:acetyl-CoA synthetase|nr:AMP-binding protein [Coriobacteriales bacterium]
MRNINLRYTKESYDANGVLSEFSLQWPSDYNFAYDVVDDIAAAEPDRPAMIWCNPEGEEHRFSYYDLKHWSDKTANFLVQQGVEKGDMVLVILRRHYQFWFTALALHKIGAVLVPATFMLKEHDFEYRVNTAGVKTVIATDIGEIAQVIDNCAAQVPALKNRILVAGGGGGLTAGLPDLQEVRRFGLGDALSGPEGLCTLSTAREGWTDFNSGVRAASPSWQRVATRASDPMITYFSSGTSGNPKMALHDYSYSLGHLGTAKHWQNVKSDGGVHFTIADTGWGKAVWGKLYGQFLMEACVLTYDYDRFDAEELMALVEKYRISTLCCPPTMYRMFLNGPKESYRLDSLEYCVCAGEALNPDLLEGWRELTGITLMDGFGQTETPLTIANMPNMTPKPGSMGRPLPLYNTRILDAEDNECEVGETGEICIAYNPAARPPGIMLEYYRDAEKTAAAIRDGWYHSGDTAWRDEDGYIFYVGRNDDVIKSSGYRISPFEVESVLLTHPAVRECAVTGVPDALRGKAVKATVVLQPGYVGNDELTAEIKAFMKRKTAPYKYPRILDYVETLPKTINGKTRRAVIRAADELGAEAAAKRPPEEFGG